MALAMQVSRRQTHFQQFKNLFARAYLSVNKFKGLAGNALLCTQDAGEAIEVAYLKELSRCNNPEAVIRQYESERFLHNNPEAVSKYIIALAKVDRLDGSESLKTLQRGISSSVREEESVGESTTDRVLGTARAPIHTVGTGGNFKEQLWHTIRTILWGFILICGAGALVDDKRISKGLGINDHDEVRPCMETSTKFKDVKGVDEAKAELEEIVHYLRDPKRFTRLGGKLPKGVLLVGPPGTGKTMLARAIAGEAGVPLFYSSGSEFEEIYVGVGARRLRNLFSAAKKQSPCIVFIDEIDSVGGSRKLWDMDMKMTLNQLLVELDGFKQNEGIIVIAATNFERSLDKALTRSGRFDRHIVVPSPDVEGRRQILESHMSKILKADDVDIRIIARQTSGLSGADLANLINIAALKAAMGDAKAVSMSDLDYARDKIMMGNERKSAVISEESRRLTAFHQSGKAVVAMHTDGARRVHKATIVPRGMSVGKVYLLPDEDESSISRKQLLADLDILMGAWAAEELILGESEVTSGVYPELSHATYVAREMITRYGMSEQVGPVIHDYYDDGISMSSETRLLIEKEVNNFLATAYNNAKTILTAHKKELHALADALLEHETLTETQIKDLLNNNSHKVQVQRSSQSEPSSTSSPAAKAKAVAPIGSSEDADII